MKTVCVLVPCRSLPLYGMFFGQGMNNKPRYDICENFGY